MWVKYILSAWEGEKCDSSSLATDAPTHRINVSQRAPSARAARRARGSAPWIPTRATCACWERKLRRLCPRLTLRRGLPLASSTARNAPPEAQSSLAAEASSRRVVVAVRWPGKEGGTVTLLAAHHHGLPCRRTHPLEPRLPRDAVIHPCAHDAAGPRHVRGHLSFP